jgi:hypothetical protein
MTLARTLERAGNDVSIVCGGRPTSTEPANVIRVPSRVPVGGGRKGRVLRRLQPRPIRKRSFARRLVAATVALRPQLIYATAAGVVRMARHAAQRSGAVVVRDPRLPDAGDLDIIHLAPGDVGLSSSPAGPGSRFHTPLDSRAGWAPIAGRYAGTVVVIVYRETATTPGRYLRKALERAGVDARHVGDRLDWSSLGEDVLFVLFVESPYPAIEVVGDNPGVPVLLWAHHGEHHTGAHLRLIERYGVHAVLLAHSWHLAHRYPVPVHRFPFAVAPETFDGGEPWNSRRYDVSFVGSLGADSGPYDARRRLMTSLEQTFSGERISITDSAAPREMARMYGDSKVVVNEGGSRHFPITMRVFEAVGSGALLVTTDAPGLSCLFSRDDEYAILDPGHPGEQISRLTEPGSSGEQIADAAQEHARGRHYYDHRVDELLAIAAETAPVIGRGWERPLGLSDLASAVDVHVEIETVAVYGAAGLGAELPLQSVWLDPVPGTRSYDAVVIGPTRETGVGAAVADAVRYVIVARVSTEFLAVGLILEAREGEVFVTEEETTVTYDLGTPGYRIPSVEENR